MAIGEPKTKLVDGMRIPVDSLTALAKNAGVENEPITPSIDASQLDEPRSTPPPTPQRSSDQLIASIADVTSGVADDTQLTREEDELRKLIRQQSGETEYRSRLEGRADIDALEKEIADIGADIKNRRAALTKGLVDTEGRPIASTFIVGRQAQQQRLAAAEIEGLEAAQSAALGNLAVAQSSIDRAVQAKYGAIREEIGIQQQLIQLRQGQMTREEKKLAEQRQAELSQLEAQVAQAQNREQTSLQQITEAVNNGMSPQLASTLSRQVINGEIQPTDVLSQVGGYLGLLQRQAAARAQQNADLARRGQLLELALAGDPVAIEELGYDPNAPGIEDKIKVADEINRLDKEISRVDAMLDNDLGLQLSSGTVRSPLPSSFVDPMGGVAFNYSKYVDAKADFLAKARYVATNLTTQKIKDLKDQGVSFTPLSNEEVGLIGDSSAEILGYAIKNDAGQIVGFTSEEGVRDALRQVSDIFTQARDRTYRNMTTSSEQTEIDNL